MKSVQRTPVHQQPSLERIAHQLLGGPVVDRPLDRGHDPDIVAEQRHPQYAISLLRLRHVGQTREA